MALLNDSEIEKELSGLPLWSRQGNEIVRRFALDDFIASVGFVDKLVAPAERLGHHPDVSIYWNKVDVKISTHSAGGLTAADFELAAAIDRLA